jgi:hypothetical protein
MISPDRRSLSGSHGQRPWVYHVLNARLPDEPDFELFHPKWHKTGSVVSNRL